MEQLFSSGKKIIRKLKAAGFDAYFVGGAVRDRLLKRVAHDVDIATSANVDEVMSLFKNTIPVGQKHGTIIVRMDKNSFEVSTFKSNGIDTPTIFTDLSCRDLTINALALTDEFKLIDPFQYKNDIKDKMIRAVDSPQQRFLEDPLRMLRAIRFVAQLGFQIDHETRQAIVINRTLLNGIAKERITQEFEKLLAAYFVQYGLQQLVETQLYKEISFTKDYETELMELAKLPFHQLHSMEEKWALFLYYSSIDLITNLYLSNKKKQEIKMILNGFNDVSLNGWTSYLLFDLGLEVAKKIVRLKHVISGELNNNEVVINEMYSHLPIQNRDEIQITGLDLINHFNKNPGAWVKKYLKRIEIGIINNEVNNNKEDLLKWIETVSKN